MTTHTFTFLKSFLVRPYISVHRFKKLVQLLPVKIRKFSCLIFGAYVFALTDCEPDGLVAPSRPAVVQAEPVVSVFLEFCFETEQKQILKENA